MKKKENKQKAMLYHPALNIPERGMTGRYMPAGVDKDGVPLIEIEFITPPTNIVSKESEKE